MRSTIQSVFSLALAFICYSHALHAAQNPLFIPPLLRGSEFELAVQSGTTELVPGFQTPTFGVNGVFLAPTLMMNAGDSIRIKLRNSLNIATTMHWHGLHVPAHFDGGPHQLIAAGATWEPHFKMLNDAGTYWYHPHGEGRTELQVTKGIAGMIIVHDSVESALGLPHNYGVDDFPVIIQTKAFDELHQLAIATEMDTLRIVNGTVNPLLNAPAQVIRLRLLNGSSMRSYLLGFSDNMDFYQIATDGGLIERALSLKRIRLSPGERVEILVDLRGRKGQNIQLINYGAELQTGIHGAAIVGNAQVTIPDYAKNPLNGANFTLLDLSVVDSTPDAVVTLPTSLRTVPTLSETASTMSRTLEFAPETMNMTSMVVGPFLINGQHFNMDVVNIRVKKDATEVWTLKNSTMVAHPFHIHDVQFNILDIQGAAVPEYLRGPKDVVLVLPQQSLRFITRFTDFADNHVPYMYHCHMLHHEDDGMMGSFIVEEPMMEVEDQGTLELDVHPNPADASLRLKCNSQLMQNGATLEVVDALGRVVFVQSVQPMQAECVLSTSAFDAGLYSVRAITATSVHSYSFVVIH